MQPRFVIKHFVELSWLSIKSFWVNSFKVVILRSYPPRNEWREKQLIPPFATWFCKPGWWNWYWNLWRWFRITGNPEIIFPPSPQHRKREIRQSQGICRPAGWLQKPAVVFVRAPGCPWKLVTIYLVFDLLTRLTSYIYIGVIIHLLSTMEIHEQASSLPGWVVLSDSQFLSMLAASRHQGAVIMVQWKMVVFNRYGDAPIFFTEAWEEGNTSLYSASGWKQTSCHSGFWMAERGMMLWSWLVKPSLGQGTMVKEPWSPLPEIRV